MRALPLLPAVMFVGSAIFQLAGVALLPATRGFTAPGPSALSALCFMVGVILLARIIASGVNVSTLIPLISAFVPLCAIVLGVMLYGEAVSWVKAGMLAAACVLVAVASNA